MRVHSTEQRGSCAESVLSQNRESPFDRTEVKQATKKVRLSPVGGQAITAFMPVHQTYWPQMFVSILIMPFGMDMSFPAATVILSNHMPREHQGLAASLVNTMVNYSISLALGIAGTVEVAVMKHDGSMSDSLYGVRCAYYTGLALAGCGFLLGVMYFTKSMIKEGWKVMQH